MTIQLPNFKIKISEDSIDESPREWDNLSKLIFFGNYKHLGDSHNETLDAHFESREDYKERGAAILKKRLNAAIVVPVNLYNHSGISISTSNSYPYDCRWDSGTCGFAVVTREDILKEYSAKRVTQDLIARANTVLQGEIETLSQYISGEVYSFIVYDNEDNIVDSCGGFYGSDIEKNGMSEHFSDEVREEFESHKKELVV